MSVLVAGWLQETNVRSGCLLRWCGALLVLAIGRRRAAGLESCTFFWPLLRSGADTVGTAISVRMVLFSGSRQRRRFGPRADMPPSFWSSQTARLAVLPLLGAATVAAFPPIYALPVLVLGFTGLQLAVRESRSVLGALSSGWAFGFGYFLAGLYWIGNDPVGDATRSGWMAVLSVIGPSALLAVFPAIAALAARLLARFGIGELASLAIAWTAAEWLRGSVPIGLPWNLLGYVWTVSDQTVQGAAFVGIYGLSLVTVLAAAAPAEVWRAGTVPCGFRRWLPISLTVLLPAALWLAGEIRLQVVPPPGDEAPNLRLVQGNMPQALRWQPAEADRAVQRYLSLSAPERPPGLKMQIWPGAAPTIALTNDPDRRTAVVATIPKGGVLLAGSMHLPDETGTGQLARGSLLGISDAGEVLAAYDRKCPAPFGQYEQLKTLLSLERLAEGRRDFVPGPATVSVPGVPPFRPLICPEAIVPGLTAPANGAQPLWLLDIANGAKFGRSNGRYQHFQMARVRAVEQGLPLVHAASTGISAVVDPLGRIIAGLRQDEAGVLDAALPAALSTATLYSRFGERLVLAMAVFIAAASVVVRRVGRTSRKFGRR